MSLDVLQPAYRNSIYATQAEQPIVVRAELPDAMRSQVVEVKLGPKTDKCRVTGYPLLFRTTISGGAKSPSDRRTNGFSFVP